MVSHTRTAARQALGRPLRSPLAAPAAWSAPDQHAGSARPKTADDLSDRQATIAEFTDYLRTISNRDDRPYQEASINAYVGPAKNLDACSPKAVSTATSRSSTPICSTGTAMTGTIVNLSANALVD